MADTVKVELERFEATRVIASLESFLRQDHLHAEGECIFCDASRTALAKVRAALSSDTDGGGAVRLRAVIGMLPGDSGPVFAGAQLADTWEIIPPDEWDAMAARWQAEATGGRRGDYDWREVFIDVQGADAALFAAPTLEADCTNEEGGERDG